MKELVEFIIFSIIVLIMSIYIISLYIMEKVKEEGKRTKDFNELLCISERQCPNCQYKPLQLIMINGLASGVKCPSCWYRSDRTPAEAERLTDLA